MKPERRFWAVRDVRVGVRFSWVVGVAEIPREVIHVGKHVTRGARAGAIAGREIRVIKQTTPRFYAYVIGRKECVGFQYRLTYGVNHAHAVRYVLVHKQARACGVQREPRRTVGDVDVLCALLAVKPALVIEAVGSAATLAEPIAATYNVSPLGLNTIAVRCARLRALSAALIAWPAAFGSAKLTCEFRCTASTDLP